MSLLNLTAREIRHIKEFGRLTATDSIEGYQVTVTALFNMELGEPTHLGQYYFCLMQEGHIISSGFVQGWEEYHPKDSLSSFVEQYGKKNE